MGFNNDSVIFYRSFYDAIESITAPVEKAKAYKAVIGYGLDGLAPKEGGNIKIIYTMAKPQIDANIQRRENGKKGGRPPSDSSGNAERKAEIINKYTKGSKSVKPKDSDDITRGNKGAKPMVNERKTIGFISENHSIKESKPNDKVNDNGNLNVNEPVDDNDKVNDNESSSSSRDEEKLDIYTQVMNLYNSYFKEFAIKSVTTNWKNNIDDIMVSHSTDDFRTVFENARDSYWLNEKRFITFDWLINIDNFVKVLSGKYKNTREQDEKMKSDQKLREIENYLGME